MLVAGTLLGCGTNASSPVDTVDAADDADASDAARACPSQLPSGSDCANTAPDYTTVVAPLLAISCGVCHSPTGIESVTLFDTYARIKADEMQIHLFTQIYDCLMPPAGAAPLSPEVRETLLQWFVCDAPFGSGAAGDAGIQADAASDGADADVAARADGASDQASSALDASTE